MKNRSFPVSTAVLLTLFGNSLHAQPAPATVPFAAGISINGYTSGVVTFATHEVDGPYFRLHFKSTQPYSLGPMISVMPLLVGNAVKNLFASAAGPAGVGAESQVLAFADLNNNGMAGFANITLFGPDNSVTVYRVNNGDSALLTDQYSIGGDVNSDFFADFNGDGLPDLAVAYDGSGKPGGIAILINKGDGTFAAPVTYASGTPASRFAVFDLNHDGFLDIAAVGYDQMVTILLGNGKGSFAAPIKYPVPMGSGNAIVIADFNRDGNPDLAVGGSVGILLGDGRGNFQAGTALPAGSGAWALAAGDLNGDGKIDLVYADPDNQLAAPMFGNGDGTFTVGQAYAVSRLPVSLVLADYDGDGKLDIINGTGDQRGFGIGANSGTFEILLNNGDGTFQGTPDYFMAVNGSNGTLARGIAAGNFGGTPGVLASVGGELDLFKSNGKAGLQGPQSIFIPGQTPGVIAAGDFNGDGKADAAAAVGSGNIAILVSNAGGFATPAIVPTGAASPSALVSADFDRDGKIDLAFVSGSPGGGSTPGTLGFLKGNGDGTFQAPVTIPGGVTPISMTAADLNGDGKPDIVFSDNGVNGVGGQIYVAINLGGGAFHAPVAVYPSMFGSFGIADVNGDGKLDLVAGNQTGDGNSALAWLQGNGDGTFKAAVAIATQGATDSDMLVQDFNGDGAADIMIAQQDGNTVLFTGNGDGTFSAETPVIAPAEPTFLATTDLNGDGKPDVIVGGFEIGVLLNNTVTTVTTANGASFSGGPVAAGSIASAFGSDLANTQMGAGSSPITNLGNTTVTLTDSAGTSQLCELFFVSPLQVNYLIPANAAPGAATLTVQSGDGKVTNGTLAIAATAPGLFAAGGQLAAALLTTANADGSNQVTTPLVSVNSSNQLVTAPISLQPALVYLLLYGTGIRGAPSQVTVQVAGQNLTPAYAGAAPGYAGEDQVNVQLPASLKGSGQTAVTVTVAGQSSNTVYIQIQ